MLGKADEARLCGSRPIGYGNDTACTDRFTIEQGPYPMPGIIQSHGPATDDIDAIGTQAGGHIAGSTDAFFFVLLA